MKQAFKIQTENMPDPIDMLIAQSSELLKLLSSIEYDNKKSGSLAEGYQQIISDFIKDKNEKVENIENTLKTEIDLFLGQINAKNSNPIWRDAQAMMFNVHVGEIEAKARNEKNSEIYIKTKQEIDTYKAAPAKLKLITKDEKLRLIRDQVNSLSLSFAYNNVKGEEEITTADERTIRETARILGLGSKVHEIEGHNSGKGEIDILDEKKQHLFKMQIKLERK